MTESGTSTSGMERFRTTPTNGFVNMGGWIPVATDWEPNIGEWWFGAFDCVEDNLRRQIVEGDNGADDTERTECWRCGYERPIFESCPECGGSCKPLTKRKQRDDTTEQTALVPATDGGTNCNDEAGTHQ